MWAILLSAGLVCGAGLTYCILSLLSQNKKTYDKDFAVPTDDDFTDHGNGSALAAGVAGLGLTSVEIAAFLDEDIRAEAEFDELDAEFDIEGKPFYMTRKRILHWAKRNLTECGEIIKRSQWHMPASLNLCGKTYALIYEKPCGEDGTDGPRVCVSMTVRICDRYAKWLAMRHPGVHRAYFPKNRNWYAVPIDGSFKNAQMVYRVLRRARSFVCETRSSPLCAGKADCKGV